MEEDAALVEDDEDKLLLLPIHLLHAPILDSTEEYLRMVGCLVLVAAFKDMVNVAIYNS